ncbi:thiamine phosphate synthase [Aquimarina intermedia]|uniref:Thiamine-phosphate pyrophosphorylase n=1 Tax=Aquimarina intermedia TaxID=350814 RepID=A0A5S5CF46_9FLAO|nr:thiamine phosphate synthase [Aquimarina intermedia]TYP77132.1 thiamine-phosphate pyrophosphorylase [Aquimarina intermedia]
MLIVLTSEKELDDEATKINQLFDHGLEYLHVRKPSMNVNGYRYLLNAINPDYYKKIMLHQFHELVVEFDLRGIHLQEQQRIDLGDKLKEYVLDFILYDYKVSSSFHNPQDILASPIHYDYMLLSPVFDAISKTGYKGKSFNVSNIKEFVIGLGGIDEKTMATAFHLGFKGVGVLGSIWNTTDFLESFNTIKNAYNCTKLNK